MDSQLDRAGRLALADDVILNEGSLNALSNRVKELHELYLVLANA